MSLFKTASLGDWCLFLCVFGSSWGYLEYHFAHADVVSPIDKRIDLIIESNAAGRKERLDFQSSVTQQLDALHEDNGEIKGMLKELTK